jgi:cysteine desulfurase
MQVYMDYAATTPVDPRVFEAMKPYVSEKFGNMRQIEIHLPTHLDIFVERVECK